MQDQGSLRQQLLFDQHLNEFDQPLKAMDRLCLALAAQDEMKRPDSDESKFLTQGEIDKLSDVVEKGRELYDAIKQACYEGNAPEAHIQALDIARRYLKNYKSVETTNKELPNNLPGKYKRIKEQLYIYGLAFIVIGSILIFVWSVLMPETFILSLLVVGGVVMVPGFICCPYGCWVDRVGNSGAYLEMEEFIDTVRENKDVISKAIGIINADQTTLGVQGDDGSPSPSSFPHRSSASDLWADSPPKDSEAFQQSHAATTLRG